jgi:uncharacterized protein
MTKISKYNFFQKRSDGSFLAYNAISGALAMMTEENFAVYKNIERKLIYDPEPSFDSEEQELLRKLEYASFAHPGNYDELDRLYFMHHLARFENSSIGFILAPTMACNMACEYCYEDNKRGRMNGETVEAILSHIEKNGRRINQVSVDWYGGEPLLAMDVMEDLTESILDLGRECKFNYNSYLITNGYLLDKKAVDKMLSIGVGGAQITLDGPAYIHNKKRPLKNGRSSYETIVENMVYASTKMRISIRVNIDRSYTEKIVSDMLKDLEEAGLKERINMYFGLLEPATSACINIADNCFDITGYSRIETKFFNMLFEKGFKVDKLPSPMGNYCVAQSISGFVMDHEGNLYRCFNHIGDRSRSMGNIRDEVNYYNHNFINLFKFDPFTKDQCRECNILPICMGGCPSRRYEQNVSDEEMCSSWKHNLPQMLEIIALSRQRQMQTAQKETT